jgi:hypothetical protein
VIFRAVFETADFPYALDSQPTTCPAIDDNPTTCRKTDVISHLFMLAAFQGNS